MKIKKTAEIHEGQDGAIWDDFLFRFDSNGQCFVYDLKCDLCGNRAVPISEFTLGGLEKIVPHSNSVSFSNEYFCDRDEFPLLYSNVYNNYAKQEKRQEGICCVYRIIRTNSDFSADLVGIVEIDFVLSSELWCSPNHDDIRPYGNFTIDRANNQLFAFTMRDQTNTTRFFCFDLPDVKTAPKDPGLGVNTVRLTISDIRYFFDCEYHHFIQGACVENGKIYSLEGFTNDKENPPALRIISPAEKMQMAKINLSDFGNLIEPELIDFANGTCYYCDHAGNLFEIEF